MTTDWTAFDRLLASRRRTIVESFADFLRLNSVSQEPAMVRATGEWLAAAMRARGLDGRVLETGGNPAVFGERRVPGATRTVLIYCHYDTKPIPAQGVASAESDRARVPARARRGAARPRSSWPASATTSWAASSSTPAAPRTTRGRSGVI